MGPTPGWATFGPPPTTKETDLAALSNMKLAMFIAIVSTALGFVFQGASFAGYSFFSVPASGAGIKFSSAGLYTILGLSIVGEFLTLVSLYLLRNGFLRLRGVDSRFQSAPTWLLLLMVAYVVLAIALILLLVGLLQFLNCVGSATIVPASCVGSAGALIGGLGVFVLAAILLLIGGIGTIINLWRLGDRYNNVWFKIGAIVFIFFGLLGAILTLVGVLQAEKSVQAGPMPGYTPTMVSPPMAPPPPPPPPAS